MCRPIPCTQSSAEEAIAAEESLLIYCKPVELYNILHRRAIVNPSFLQRCLRYKIQARRRRRLQMTVSLLSTRTEGVQAKNLFPVYIFLAKPLSDSALAGEQQSAVYRLVQSCKLTSFAEIEAKSRAEAKLIVPEINKLSHYVQAGKLTILLVSFGEAGNSSGEGDLTKANVGGNCSWGKLPMESLCMSLERCVSLAWGHRAETVLNVDVQSCFLQPCCLEEGSYLTFQSPWNSGNNGSYQQVQVNIASKVVGPIEKSPYDSFMSSNIPTSALSNVIRLRAGNVIFNYRDLNNMLRKTEVTEDFSCPFCLVQCACFKGLRYHLISSHDLFNFEFWVTEEFQAVNVSVKIDISRYETVTNGVNPQLQTFFFCAKSRKRRRPKKQIQNGKHVYPLLLESGPPKPTREGTSKGFLEENDGEKARKSISNSEYLLQGRNAVEKYNPDPLGDINCTERVASSFNIMGVPIAMAQSSVDPECYASVSGNDLTAPAMLPCAKSRKLSLERSDSRNRQLLQKRQFFHSHRAQPMALDQVLSDRDSEDEVDDDIEDLEDRRMLDDFVDVTKDEKQLMHLWNSFVRKQRVLADGHISWACEAFSKLHGQELVQNQALFWCWRLFMIKLWNHGLLDARTMNNCNVILEKYRNGGSEAMKS